MTSTSNKPLSVSVSDVGPSLSHSTPEPEPSISSESDNESESGGPGPLEVTLSQIKEWKKIIFRKDKCLSFPLNKDLRTRGRKEGEIEFNLQERGYDPEVTSCDANLSFAVVDLLGHATFSIFLCSPAAFLNKPLLLLDAIWYYLHTQMGLKGLCYRLFKNCYLYYRSNRGPSVYNRYK